MCYNNYEEEMLTYKYLYKHLYKHINKNIFMLFIFSEQDMNRLLHKLRITVLHLYILCDKYSSYFYELFVEQFIKNVNT